MSNLSQRARQRTALFLDDLAAEGGVKAER